MYAKWAARTPEDAADVTYDADRTAANELAAQFETTIPAVRENRAFVERSVRFAAGEGLRQFVDLGSGPPIRPSVAAIARDEQNAIAAERAARDDSFEWDPPAHVVYVDSDEVAIAQHFAVGEISDDDGTTAIVGNLLEPEAIFTDPLLRDCIDVREPMCLLLNSVLHFSPPDDARKAVRRMVSLLAPGSLVAISVGLASPEVVERFAAIGITGHVHTEDDVAGYFKGLELVEPGITWARDWRPDREEHYPVLRSIRAGVGRKA